MGEDQIREGLHAHWQASAVGDANAEHDIYDDDAICDYPQSGERILGRRHLQALRSHHPGKPRNGKVVHETQYFADPFEAPAWRSQWVEHIA
jgi:hypothetical protein